MSTLRTVTRALVLAGVLIGLIAGCGDNTEKSAEGSKSAKPLKIAYLAGILANPYIAASIETMKVEAKENNVELTVIDSGFDPTKQHNQLQDIVASGRYDGVIVMPINGPALAPVVSQAVKAGIEVGVHNLPLGPDLTTADIQVDGVAISVMRPTSEYGRTGGVMTVAACEGIDPCKVVYMYGVKALPLDQQLRKSFDAVVRDHDNIEVVAEAEGQYSRDGGRKAVQDVVQSQRSFDVIVGSDQSLLGAEPIFKDSGLAGKTKIIGLGSTRQSVAAVRRGDWFGVSVSLPRTEARLVLGGLVAALRTDAPPKGIDSAIEAGVANEGMITQEHADEFEAEFDG